MMGCNNGVAALLKQCGPAVVEIHCIAHRLELSVLDAVKEVSFVETFESSLKAICSFYHRSPKHLREMREI